METIIVRDEVELGRLAAEFFLNLLNRKPNAVLGLATGSTPIPVYQNLVQMHQDGQLDFSRVVTFNLDEYVGVSSKSPISFAHFMHEHFFQHVNIPRNSIHIPSDTTTNHEAFCRWYEAQIESCGGIDLQLLGIGTDGHIAFNEPGSSLGSRTGLKMLNKQTIADNAKFFAENEDVPTCAITMGVGTILEARHCLLIASGAKKAKSLAQAIEGPISASVTASALQLHPNVTAIVDEAAASMLVNVDYYRHVRDRKQSFSNMYGGF